MTNLFPKKYLGFLFLLLSLSVYSQDPPPLGCPGIDLGTVTASCANPVQTLVADYYDIGESTSYRVDAIPYAPPFPYTGGSGSTNITADDRWSELISLGFDFCFFGGAYSRVLLSSNGALTFSIAGVVPGGVYSPGTGAGYPLTGSLPGNDGSYTGIGSDPRALLGIFGVLQDTDPSNSGSDWNINYQIAGEAPCRRLVFNIYRLGQFSCGTGVGPQTYQMVLYEVTNVIEVYVENRTPCTGWMSGNGLIGIQNADASQAYYPGDPTNPDNDNRNTGAWTATNEAWRFTPNGPSIVTIDWLDENDNVLHTGTSFTVDTQDIVYDEDNPDDGWKVRATYNTCYGPVIVENPIVLEFDDIDLGPDIETCSSDDIELDADPGLDPDGPQPTYEWFFDDGSGAGDVLIPGESDSTFIVQASEDNSGIYTAIVTFPGGCESEDSIDILFKTPPVINPTPDTLIVCDTDNDGYAPFILSDADLDILNGLALTVSYHETPLNAENNLFPLADGYINDDPYNDVVFARVDDPATGCYSVVTLPLLVRDRPVPNEPTPLRLCDDDTDGFQIFDLRVKEPEMLGSMDPLDYDFYYFENEADAEEAGGYALDDPAAFETVTRIRRPDVYQNTINPQTIYVLVVGSDINSGEKGCYEIVELELFVDPLPTPIQPEPYALCDDAESGSVTDQKSTFDLTSRFAEITGDPDSDLVITWYETLADEQSNTPISNPNAYQNRAIPPAPLNPQTVIARVTNTFGCSTLVTLTLVVNPLPVPAVPTPLEVCDDDEDGIAEFEIPAETDAEITNGEPNVVIRYYTTEALAIIGSLANNIVGPFYNDQPFNDSVWARVENEITGCFAIMELELVVNLMPSVPTEDFGDLMICDSGNGNAIFDLTLNTPFVYDQDLYPDFIIAYYKDLTEAENAQNPIGNPRNFESAGQTIWVRVENDQTGCFRISEFELIVGENPTIVEPQDMELCDDLASGSDTDGISTFDLTLNNGTITDGDTSLQIFYYETEADMEGGLENHNPISNPASYQNPDNGGIGITPYTIFVRVFNNSLSTDVTPCYSTTTLNLVVLPVPRAVEPSPLVLCDDNNDGFGDFILTDKDAEIANGNPAIVITYHETMVDAENGDFPLASPFENVVRYSQTVYARATFGAAPNTTGCFTVVPLELIVSPIPVVPLELPDLVKCDIDGTGGFVEFDLTEQAPLIYGTQEPTDFVLTYHLTQADADNGTPFISNPGAYPNISNPQEIYVRLEFVDGEKCYDTGHFTLIVADEVVVNTPEPLVVCSPLGEPNGTSAIFDLTVKNAEITGGASGMGVSYFLTEQDAIDNVDRISPDTAFENTENPQRIYVRVVDGDSDCVAYTSLLLKVLPNPEPITPTPIELCDITIVDGPGPDDGIEIFDLTERSVEILNGGVWRLSYFESYDNAVLEADAIPNPDSYENTSSPQTVYVRVTNDESDCFEIVALELIVNPVPLDTAEVSPYLICEIGTDELAMFDLTTKIPEILGENQLPSDFEVNFYLDPIDAENDVNRILNVTEHQNRNLSGAIENPQIIYTGIKYNNSECRIGGVQSFELIVQEGAVATTPALPFEICDNVPPSDGFAEFDLEDFSNQQVVDLRNEILTGQDPAIYSLNFYETLENANAGTNPIVFPYTNTINPQVVYARVTNEDNLYEPRCNEVVEVILKVRELPLITFDDVYGLCVDANGNPIEGEDGVSPPVIDTGLDPDLYTFEWMYEGVLLADGAGPSIVATQAGEYTVTVTEIATGCQAWAVATVVLSSPPLTYSATETTMAFSDSHIIRVYAEGLGTYEYQLDDGPFQDSSVFENVLPGSHTVTIRDVNGCGSVTLEVGTIGYPLYFTPNGDGYHDTWGIPGLELIDPTATIYIYDRFGKLLKELSAVGRPWDGTFNGHQMPSSDYWFRLDYIEEGVKRQLKGHFTLKR